MIPEFNKHGNLPAGIYKSSIICIENKFGKSSEERISLFNDFRKFLKMLSPFKKNIKRLILDGSFVTSKESPGDIDCIMIIENNFRFSPEIGEKINRSKTLFNIELILHEEKNIYQLQSWIDYFSKDKELKPKGLVEEILWLKTKDNINIPVQNFKTSR